MPVEEESNNFVIMVKGDAWANPVVIDQYNLLTLASDSAIKAPYRGNVKMFSLLGFCGNQRQQFKFLNIQPHDNEIAMPNFNLANCSQTSNFVYFINDQYIKVLNRNKFIDFAKVGMCQVN